MNKTPRLIWSLVFLIICNFTVYANLNETYNASVKPTSKSMKQAPYLKAGDTVAIVAPSGILNHREKEINLAKKLLKSWGLNVVIGKHVFNKSNHFAGTDHERTEDLQWALDDPSIKAIWCARGGYGTVRILDKLDYSKFVKKPKWLIGYSDITALHNQIHNLGYASVHGLMCTSMSEDQTEIASAISSMKKAIFGKTLSYTVEGDIHNKTGNANGALVGGNLTLLHTMLGSDTSVDTSGKILFIEEIGEYKYHIDRMLQSLKRAGYFDNCEGLIVGHMSRMRKNTTAWGSTVEQLILDALDECDFPILFGFPAGHEDDNRALILGKTVELNVTNEKGTVVFEN